MERPKIWVPDAPNFITPPSKFGGFFTLATDKRGVLAEFPNLILNNGLNMLGGTISLQYCSVGSGNTPPTEVETQLVAKIVTTSTYQNYLKGKAATTPFYTWSKRTFVFSTGTAAGNVSEVGVGGGNTGLDLFSRALIKDPNGDPLTITILSDEILYVTYELRVYPPLTDATGTLVLGGNKGGTHNWTLRAADIDSFTSAYNPVWDSPPTSTVNSFNRAYSGAIGDVFSLPAGSSLEFNNTSQAAYVSNSFKRRVTFTAQPAEINIAGGIRSMKLSMVGLFQIQFEPPIPKTVDDQLTLTFDTSWGRL